MSTLLERHDLESMSITDRLRAMIEDWHDLGWIDGDQREGYLSDVDTDEAEWIADELMLEVPIGVVVIEQGPDMWIYESVEEVPHELVSE